jgi:hypothetical protein
VRSSLTSAEGLSTRFGIPQSYTKKILQKNFARNIFD